MKQGQIAHLDKNRENNSPENLVFLCLDHHDQYDSRTSQSKGPKQKEVEHYRDKLHRHLSTWGGSENREGLLNFLAFSIDLTTMAAAAVNACKNVVYKGFAEELAFEILITDEREHVDGDLYYPHVFALDQFASWSWLTYSETTRDEPFFAKLLVERKPVCDFVANEILEGIKKRGDSIESLLGRASFEGWSPPAS